MPKLVGIKERTHRPVEGCGRCDVILGFTERSFIVQRCPHCGKGFCLDCYPKHSKSICKVLSDGIARK